MRRYTFTDVERCIAGHCSGMTDSQPTPSGRWYSSLLAEFDAGANPRDVAARILTDSPMIIPIVVNYISWEVARHALAENYPAAKRLAELWLLLADPSYSRRPASPPSALVEQAGAGGGENEPRIGLYL